jgi:hypothetical protein
MRKFDKEKSQKKILRIEQGNMFENGVFSKEYLEKKKKLKRVVFIDGNMYGCHDVKYEVRR